MIRLYRIVIVSIFLVGTSVKIINAQERARTQFQEYSTGVGSYIQGIPVTKSPIRGTIYLYENYASGNIITNEKEEITDVQLRYNVQDQKIEMKKDEMDIQLNGKLIKSFQIIDNGQSQFLNVFSLPVEKKHGLDGFLQVLSKKEDQMLLKRWYINLKKANYNIALSTGTKYDEAIMKNEMYIVHDNRLISFKGKSKEIKDSFPGESKELLAFIKDNKIKFKTADDFIAFFNFLVSLD